MNSHVNRALRQCVDVFERLGINYVVMGGFAVRAYAIPRPTFDVDFTVDVAADRLGQLFDALDERGYTVPDAYRAGWLERMAEMPLFKARLFLPGDQPHGIDIDVFVAESPYQKALFERRQRVLLKLVAGRPKDMVDVGDILFTQGKLDEAYLRSWADRLGVREKLETALQEAQAGPM